MSKNDHYPDKRSAPGGKPLRKKAELFLREQEARTSEQTAALSSEEVRQTLYELQVHHIELQMQNEELRRAQAALEESRSRYFDIYDLAPVGYCTVSKKGIILEANLTTGLLLGIARGALRGMPFSQLVFREDQDIYYLHRKQLLESDEPQKIELRMTRPGNTPLWVLLSATTAQDHDDSLVCRVVLSDISKRKEAETVLRTILMNVPDVIARFDRSLCYLFINDAGVRELDMPEDHILGKTSREMGMPESVANNWEKTLHSVFLNNQVRSLSMEYATSQGTKYFHSLIAPEVNDEGKVFTVICITREVTKQKMMEQQLFLEKEQFRTTLLSVGDGVISTDSVGNVVVINKVAEQLTGWSLAKAMGKPLEQVFVTIHEDTRERCDDPIARAMEAGTAGSTKDLADQVILVSNDGVERPIEESASPIMNIRNEFNGVVLVFRDCTDKKRNQDKMEYLSFNDALTGLYNRRFFDEELIKLDVEESLPFTLVMLDVNGLKLTNDAFGHVVGDQLLQKVAAVLRSECRAKDVIARIGGDELAIALPTTDPEQASRLMHRIQSALSREKVAGVPLSVASGWATKKRKHEDIHEVFKDAEGLMYRDKSSGRISYHHRAIQLIRETIQERMPEERHHSDRVGELCGKIGSAMGCDQAVQNDLITAGKLHDIGKSAIGKDVLKKNGGLSPSEWFDIKRHPEVGFNILSSTNEYARIAEYVLGHHERWDGTGYPHGIKEDGIPLPARILAIADAFDSMTMDRPFCEGKSQREALEEIQDCAGKQFDPKVVEAFARMMQGDEPGN